MAQPFGAGLSLPRPTPPKPKQMSLTCRLTVHGEEEPSGPEDYLGTALGIIFTDDVENQHGGDTEHPLSYASPHLPRPLLIELADPERKDDRRLFSHFLWNASLLLAELVEADSLGVPLEQPRRATAEVSFDVRGLATLELGAGTALPSVMAALLGARRVAVTDYPAETVLETLRANVARNTQAQFSPLDAGSVTPAAAVTVDGHSWGRLEGDPFSVANRHSFDRVIAADCLWMPWEHANLLASIAHFLRPVETSRAWVVAGFHTGREKMRGFFDPDALARAGLELDCIWERDCNGVERDWSLDREEYVSVRKRWLVVASLKPILS